MADEKTPYNVYGGMQDNGVWFGASTNKPEVPWTSLMGGDGMVVAVDTRSNEVVYTGFQFGNYFRINTKTEERKLVTPGHDIGRDPNRWNWRTPAVLSSHNQDIFYMGSQYVYRSMDKGDTWETISPGLTKNQKSGNVPFAKLSVIEESPLESGTLYAGSDDGNIWVTKDHGDSWIDISKGLPQNRWVSSITPSQFADGSVYVTLNGYRYDEFSPFVYKSTDYGKTWISVSANLPKEAVNVIKEDHTNPNILYLVTDHGLYVSLNGGKSYELFQVNIPNVAIYDMVIKKRENDLAIGSHGSSVFVVDLDPLQKVTLNPAAEAKLLRSSEIRTNQKRSPWAEKPATKPSQSILYFINQSGQTDFEVKNEKGESLKSRSVTSSKGVNSTGWEYGNIGKGKYTILIKKNSVTDDPVFEIK